MAVLRAPGTRSSSPRRLVMVLEALLELCDSDIHAVDVVFSTWSIRAFAFPVFALISTSCVPRRSSSSLLASGAIMRRIMISICAMVMESGVIPVVVVSPWTMFNNSNQRVRSPLTAGSRIDRRC